MSNFVSALVLFRWKSK